MLAFNQTTSQLCVNNYEVELATYVMAYTYCDIYKLHFMVHTSCSLWGLSCNLWGHLHHLLVGEASAFNRTYFHHNSDKLSSRP